MLTSKLNRNVFRSSWTWGYFCILSHFSNFAVIKYFCTVAKYAILVGSAYFIWAKLVWKQIHCELYFHTLITLLNFNRVWCRNKTLSNQINPITRFDWRITLTVNYRARLVNLDYWSSGFRRRLKSESRGFSAFACIDGKHRRRAIKKKFAYEGRIQI